MASIRESGWFGRPMIGTIFIGAGYFVSHLAMNAYHLGQASETWSTVPGDVMHSKVVSSPDSRRKTHTGHLRLASVLCS